LNYSPTPPKDRGGRKQLSPEEGPSLALSRRGDNRIVGRLKKHDDISRPTFRASQASFQAGERERAPARPHQGFDVEFAAI